MKFINGSKPGIATKTALVSGLIVLILLGVSSIISIYLQSRLSQSMIDDYTQSQSQERKEFAETQNKLIRENVRINLKICSSIASSLIFNFDQSGLEELLAGFLKIEEIEAIRVIDEGGQPFVAAWKDPVQTTGTRIPAEVNLREDFSFSQDTLHEGSKIGTVQFYFTDQLVKNEIDKNRKKTEEKIAGFNAIADKSIANSVKIQILAAICIVVVLIASIVFCLRYIVSKPINTLTQSMFESADHVTVASGQVSTSSQLLAEISSEQAASIEETSASMEEMDSMTKNNAVNASQADNLMKDANQVVNTANESMGKLIQSMVDISKASEETSKIIKTIDEISFQTNLLALNAAVEAARAGEAGAGFAVVADEVRNLAMRAAEAASNTARLIEETVKKVNLGEDLVSKTNEAFGQVAESTAKVGDLVSEISAASKEQSDGIEQINATVAEMDKTVQQNAASAEESASLSEEMSAQSEQLKSYIGELLQLIRGTKEGEPANSFVKSDSAMILESKPNPVFQEKAPRTVPQELGPDSLSRHDEDERFMKF
ncbi:Methyl-accepting chemotaxis protein [Olavius algarvensis Delta 1 endosymbiont]|nr:Methyl-accepting chemotaxis protein [Olavius algarvensis Delta 1 endosymbiont]